MGVRGCTETRKKERKRDEMRKRGDAEMRTTRTRKTRAEVMVEMMRVIVEGVGDI